MLEFGTAGLRGALGAGPNRMNRAVVLRAAAGLTAYLLERADRPLVVVGYDARHNSDVFARDTAAVVVAAGGTALLLPRPLPTPVLAFAIRHLGADAGVMVTASHNPPQDNGYKVYLGDGSQIVPPADADIAAHIDRVDRVADIPRADDGWEVLGEQVRQDYLAAATAVVDPHGPRELTMVHTSLHGVGNEVVQRAFAGAGFAAPVVVPSQSEPDPAFPTVAFPNPEEPGAIDAALALAAEVGADLVLANDPDADRCAAAVPDPAAVSEPTPAAGGCCAATRSAPCSGRTSWPAGSTRTPSSPTRSSPRGCSRALARAAGVRHEETLTGFKWIARVPGLRYGYEEALGYCVDPRSVRTRTGSARRCCSRRWPRACGRRGARCWTCWTTWPGPRAARHRRVLGAGGRPGADRHGDGAAALDPPGQVGGVPVTRVDDLAQGPPDLPPTEGLRYHLADGSRVIVRPSGTEPKLKAYLEVDRARRRASPACRRHGSRPRRGWTASAPR